MPTYGFIGEQGFGKSSSMCEFGLFMANKYNKSCLAANFPFNLTGLWEYSINKKYWHLCSLIENNKLLYFDPNNLMGLLTVKDAIIFFDEAPQFLSSRSYKQNNNVVRVLSQIRKKHSDMLYASQNWDSIDSELKRQTHYIFNCEGVLVPDLNGGYPKLVKRDVSLHLKHKYIKWKGSEKRDKYLFRINHQMKRWGKPVSVIDLLLFNLYDSDLDLGDDNNNDLPSSKKIIYFKDKLDFQKPETVFNYKPDGSYSMAYQYGSTCPIQWIKNIDYVNQKCRIPRVIKNYWNIADKFPAVMYPVFDKIFFNNKCQTYVEWSGTPAMKM